MGHLTGHLFPGHQTRSDGPLNQQHVTDTLPLVYTREPFSSAYTKKQPYSLWKIFVNICCYLSGSRGLCWAELNCSNVRSKSDNIVASEHCHNPRLCRYLHFLPHSQLAALLTSPQSPGRAEISKIFIYCSGLLCPGNVPGHAGEETRSYGLQLAATATLHQLQTRDGERSS